MKIQKLFVGLIVFGTMILSSISSSFAADKMRVVVTTPLLVDFVRGVAGADVQIHSVAGAKENMHFVNPTPKDVLMLKKADVFVHQGLDGEPWREPLVNAAGNRKFIGQGEGSIDVSVGVRILEVPTSLSRMEGDIHIYGNPHYLMDPENALIVLGNIRDGLSRIYPDRENEFRENSERVIAQIRERIPVWKDQMRPYEGRAIVVYHKSWSYLAQYFNLKIVGDIEPKPGIQPTARHLSDLEKIIESEKAAVIIRESYQNSGVPNKLAKKTGIQSIELHQQPEKGETYISLMNDNIRVLANALAAGGVR